MTHLYYPFLIDRTADFQEKVRMMIRLMFHSLLAVVLPTLTFAQSKLPTVEEAQATSQKTGRPIFAMAGQET